MTIRGTLPSGVSVKLRITRSGETIESSLSNNPIVARKAIGYSTKMADPKKWRKQY